ncbi:hypothetical protein [Thalassomonas sp. RHCl1]|uniref:hypothetical protein n=1 Tax=Thalassomonas sp. RHCl1 TaxID=2995320 RepID=UPI00248AD3A7|nr:hypothetical protein [Thalassomonas sp. RHCl1]
MYVLISVTLLVIFVLGVLLDFFRTARQRSMASRHRKILKFKAIVIKTQRLLNGQAILPLTAVSSIVCLERALVALKALADLENTKKRHGLIASMEKKLENFRALTEAEPYYYALLSIPTDLNELGRILKQAMLLMITLKVEHAKGKLSDEQLEVENHQLDILIVRLKAEIYKNQSMRYVEQKKYAKAQALNDKAVEILGGLTCENEEVMKSVTEAIDSINVLNVGVTGVIEEQNHTFYDKFKKEAHEKEEEKPFEVDDMELIFGKKRKY